LSSAPNEQSQVLSLSGNNSDLQEETADVWTAGFDLTPAAIEGLSLSLTYFDIDYQDKIVVPAPTSTILVQEVMWRESITRNPTQAQIDALCNSPGFIGACPATVAAIVDIRPRNLAGVEVRGIDADIKYAFPTRLGQWDFGVRGTYTSDYVTQVTETAPTFAVVDTLENPLALRLSASASWNLLSWSWIATVNYTGAYDNPGAISSSKIDSYTTIDLGAVYRMDDGHGWLDNTRLSLSAVNLFDKEPPFVDIDGAYGYDNANGSLLGRQLSAQIVKQW
jgi:iron complex outermembrane receptor protein